MARYSRKWTVYVVQNVHGMLGWARSYAQAQDYYAREVRGNLDLMDSTDGYRPEEQHRYTLDCFWPLDEYVKRFPDEAERVRRRIGERRLEVSPYEASTTDMCLSGEELIRCFARPAAQRHGFGTLPLVVHTDVHSYAEGFPSIAAGCGIKYLMVGTNGSSVVGFKAHPEVDVVPRGRALFWWQGPDGRRLLCFHYGGYAEASGAWGGDDFNPGLVESYLQRFEDMGDAYPYDAVVMFGTGGDAIRRGDWYHSQIGTDRLRRWNEEHDARNAANLDAPLLVNGRLLQFFERAEQCYGARIPTFVGGWGGGELLWDSQSQRFAKAGLQARLASASVRVAETLAAAASGLHGAPYPDEAIERLYQYRIWHDEHDANGTRSLVTDETKQEWRAIQACWGREELEQPARLALENATAAFAGIKPAPGPERLLVYNPLSRCRSDVVRWRCPDPGPGHTWKVTDDASGALLASQYVVEDRVGELLFIARDVPSLGYRTYTIGGAVPVSTEPLSPSGWGHIENEFYRVASGRLGAIGSIWDKQAGREMVSTDRLLNLYINGRSTASSGGGHVENFGPVGASLLLSVSGLPERTHYLRSRVWVYAGIPRVDIVNEFAIAEAEQEIYYDFPLDPGGPPTYTLEGPSASILTPGRRQFDEAKLTHWNTFSFVDVSSPDYGISLLSPDARQAFLGARLGEGDPVSDPARPGVLFRVAGGADPLQDWNDVSGGHEDNPFRYRFSLTSHSGRLDVGDATDAGWGQLFPMQVSRLG
ncbi:MAG: glycoside hydrolase family 38 N-terminal domain-containing protein, partial [Anaerolineae bacterium]